MKYKDNQIIMRYKEKNKAKLYQVIIIIIYNNDFKCNKNS